MLVANGDGEAVNSWVVGSFKARPADATNAPMLIDSRHTLLSAYIKTTRMHKCPSDRSLGRNPSINPANTVHDFAAQSKMI